MKREKDSPAFEQRYLTPVLTILLGILLLVRPRFVIGTGARILGVLLMAAGILSFLSQRRNRQAGDYFLYASGFAYFLAGLIVLTKYRSILSIFPTVTGLLTVVSGLIHLSRSYELGRAGYRSWLFPALGSLIVVFLGMYILLHPFRTINLIARFAGADFIYNGLVDLFLRRRF